MWGRRASIRNDGAVTGLELSNQVVSESEAADQLNNLAVKDSSKRL